MTETRGAINRRSFLAAGAALLAGCGASGRAVAPVALWGAEGIRDGGFLRPRAIGAHRGEIYVIDMSGRVQVFTPEGTFARMWEMPQHDNGAPTAIVFDGDRAIVPDTHYSRIIEYSLQGEERHRWGSFGSAPEQFIYPTGLALGTDGSYYFSEYGQQAERIHVFSAARAFVRQWGAHGEAPGQFSRAMGIVRHPNGRLYVADTANHRVQVFTTDGALMQVFGADPAQGPPLRYPQGIAVAPDGSIFLAEYGGNCVSRYAPDGRFLAVYGHAGRGPGAFNAPRGIAVDEHGTVYVADTDNHRVQAFTPGNAA
jgi:sugar lactone lactonase YvrE